MKTILFLITVLLSANGIAFSQTLYSQKGVSISCKIERTGERDNCNELVDEYRCVLTYKNTTGRDVSFNGESFSINTYECDAYEKRNAFKTTYLFMPAAVVQTCPPVGNAAPGFVDIKANSENRSTTPFTWKKGHRPPTKEDVVWSIQGFDFSPACTAQPKTTSKPNKGASIVGKWRIVADGVYSKNGTLKEDLSDLKQCYTQQDYLEFFSDGIIDNVSFNSSCERNPENKYKYHIKGDTLTYVGDFCGAETETDTIVTLNETTLIIKDDYSECNGSVGKDGEYFLTTYKRMQ